MTNNKKDAPLAQLDRASGYGPEGQEFESLTACQKNTEFERVRCFSFFSAQPRFCIRYTDDSEQQNATPLYQEWRFYS